MQVPSLVSLDYNDFDDENSSPSPSTSKRQDKEKKPEDMELTVYDDIVLVESCQGESNLEVRSY